METIEGVADTLESSEDGHTDIDGCDRRTRAAGISIATHLGLHGSGVCGLLLFKEAQLLRVLLVAMVHQRDSTGGTVERVESHIVRLRDLWTCSSAEAMERRREGADKATVTHVVAGLSLGHGKAHRPGSFRGRRRARDRGRDAYCIAGKRGPVTEGQAQRSEQRC
jgi:hypothetical protein